MMKLPTSRSRSGRKRRSTKAHELSHPGCRASPAQPRCATTSASPPDHSTAAALQAPSRPRTGTASPALPATGLPIRDRDVPSFRHRRRGGGRCTGWRCRRCCPSESARSEPVAVIVRPPPSTTRVRPFLDTSPAARSAQPPRLPRLPVATMMRICPFPSVDLGPRCPAGTRSGWGAKGHAAGGSRQLDRALYAPRSRAPRGVDADSTEPAATTSAEAAADRAAASTPHHAVAVLRAESVTACRGSLGGRWPEEQARPS